jgi:hypothetical protein
MTEGAESYDGLWQEAKEKFSRIFPRSTAAILSTARDDGTITVLY